MKYVALRYGVTFGKGDSSDWIDWDLQLTDEEERIYDHAIANKLPLNELPELEGALRRAYEEIEDEEISMGIDNGDEYTMECQGEAEVDPDEINDLIADRDPHALAFFGLEDADDDELVERICSGEIEDGKTQAAVLKAALLINREKDGKN